MILIILSNNKKMLHKINMSYQDIYANNPMDIELITYDPSISEDEHSIIKMCNDIERSNVCILDINTDTASGMLFNAVCSCTICNGFIIPIDINNSIRNYLRLGSLTIKDITSVNPKYDIITNYSIMVKIIENIEQKGGKALGKLKDFQNYLLICEYINKNDLDSSNKLLTLLDKEYGEYSLKH